MEVNYKNEDRALGSLVVSFWGDVNDENRVLGHIVVSLYRDQTGMVLILRVQTPTLTLGSLN